jgi:hypothetical protein
MTVQVIQDLSLHEGIVLIDCKQLADAFSSKRPPQDLD